MPNVLRSTLERSKNRVTSSGLFRNRIVRFALKVLSEMNDDDASYMAASVSYFALLSLFPLILGVSSIVGWVAGSVSRQQQVIDFVAENIPGSHDFVRDSVDALVQHRGALGIISVVGLLWAAGGVFGSINRAINRAWKVHKREPFYRAKPRQIIMALTLAVPFAISLGITSIFQWAGAIEIGNRSIEEIVGGSGTSFILKFPVFIVTFLIFYTLYRWVPNTKTYWRDVWPGALVGSLLFETAKYLFVWYLENFGRYDQLYGNIASVVVLMFWTYLSAYILIIGAEVSSLLAAQRRERDEARHLFG